MDVRGATGTSEREGALYLIDEMLSGAGCTLGADEGYYTKDFARGAVANRREGT